MTRSFAHSLAQGSEDEEDYGCLMTFVYDAGLRRSFLLVYDARTMEEVAEVNVKARVPYGFHGLFLNEGEIEATRKKEEKDLEQVLVV